MTGDVKGQEKRQVWRKVKRGGGTGERRGKGTGEERGKETGEES